MKIPFRHSKADSRIEARSEPMAAMIKRVADEHRQRGVAGPALTPATVVGRSGQPLEVVSAPVVAPPAPPAPAPALTAGVSEVGGGGAALTTCAKGHRFARLSDHPVVDGVEACPHCMAKTLSDYRKIFAAIVRPVRYE
ncbi:MAG: hypothetical protein ABI520_09010 [Caldimonas sp.]